jgi:acetate---CoA ligase (ADP-forming)
VTATATAGPQPRDVILRDGTTLRLRPPSTDDLDALMAFFAGLSAQSLYQRFHGGVSVRPELVQPVLEPDWHERGCLVATVGDEVVAVANYVRLRDPAKAEVAFAVADELQGRGVGTRLLEQLADLAGGHGITQFLAVVMPGNRPMLDVLEGAGFAATRTLAEGEIEVELAIAPTSAYRERVDERDHVAVTASLAPFFAPQAVAVVGASRRRGSIGGELFRNILDGDFTGAAYPVNQRAEPVAGVRAYRSVAEIPDRLDLVVVCLPGDGVLAAAREALERGVRALCVISAGFAETGRKGAERQEQLLALVRTHGARLIGPNCLGIAVSRPRLNATFAPRAFAPGTIGFSSQSGALGLAVLERAAARGLGLSAFVSIGNKADVSSNDLLEFWEDDPDTELIALYLESFGNPRRFGRVARRVAGRKPILAMKGGATRAGARAARSHTAALAGSDAAVDALFRQAGVTRARTLEELLDAAAFFSSQPLPRGRRVAILTNAGGLAILAADACDAVGLELAELADATSERLGAFLPAEASVANPVDMLGGATGPEYERAIPALLADPNVDALIVLFVPPVVAGADEIAAAVARAVPDEGKPVLACLIAEDGIPAALRDGKVAAFDYPESAAFALGAAADRAEWLRRPVGTVPEPIGVDRQAARGVVDAAFAQADDAWLAPREVRALLTAYGIPLVPELTADSPEEAATAAERLGFPAVVKTAAAGAHKTETGGVALGLSDAGEVRAAAARIGGPVLVQPMLSGGAELLAGLVQDPVFGPLVAFGPGGVLAELIGAAEFRIAPLTDVDVHELLTTGKAGKLVAGYRGSPPADTKALADLLHRLSLLGEELPEVAELDLNPVIAGPDGCVAVDGRVRVSRPQPGNRLKTW